MVADLLTAPSFLASVVAILNWNLLVVLVARAVLFCAEILVIAGIVLR
jgi:hypothetical protein